ncbi:hypothetical protein OHR68_43160 [Spirillospora sp. NBC_00431]
MAIVASWSGRGLSDGTALTTATQGSGDTLWDTVTAGAFTIDASGLHSPRIQVDQQAAAEARLIWDTSTLGTLAGHAVRMYVELTAYPSANARILGAHAVDATLQWFLQVATDGTLRLRSLVGIVDSSAEPLPLDAELRIEVVGDGTGAVTVDIYEGDATTTWDVLSGTGLGTDVEEIRFANPATTPTWPRFYLDELAVADTATLIGPADVPGAPARFPLDDRYELLLDGTWTDITGYVYERDPVTITRGRSAEAQTADPSKMSLTLNNRDGRFSARNPISPYFGILGRNTQIRASLPAPAGYLRIFSSDTEPPLSCPSAAALNVTDLDVRLDMDVNTWRTGNIAGKYDFTAGECSWFLDLSGERVFLVWSPTGADVDRIQAGSTVPIPTDRRRVALRITLDVNNGAGGYDVKFWTADTIAGPWTQLGATVTGTSTTAIAATTADLEVGGLATIAGFGPDGTLWAFELRDGIDGTLVAAPDFDAQTPGDTSFADAQGNTWTLGAAAALDDRDYRFYGEVATWPTTWAVNGDHHVKLQAAGIKRRLTQNAPVLRSTMYREFANPARTGILVYWPMEDGREATRIAAAGDGHPPMRVEGTPSLAEFDEWTASDALPVMAAGRLSGMTPAQSATGEVSVRLFVFVDQNVAAETSLLHLNTVGGTVREWEVRLTTAGGLRTRAYDADRNSLLDHTSAFDMQSRGFTILDIELTQDGADIDWSTLVVDFVHTQTITDTITQAVDSGTLAGNTFGRVQRVTVGRDKGLTNVVTGHLAVATDLEAYASTSAAIAAQNGEDPLDRMKRLCDEEEISFVAVTRGRTGNAVTLGDQLSRSLVELLQEAADADGGLLYEPRYVLGFAHRSRQSMYNQAAAVTLDYSAGQVEGDLVPLDDDQATENDITVKREAGSSVRVEQTTGPLSVADPPDGVGRYEQPVTLSLTRDEQLPDQAAWRLHLGTVDEGRFPHLTVNLRAPAITDALYEEIVDIDVGDRIVLTGIPDGLPPDDVELLVLGYTETLRVMGHEIEFNLAPASPWRVAIRDDADHARRDSTTSTLAVAVDADDTSWSVATTGTLWTTAAGDFPFDLIAGGERVTATAIASTTSPQTFTVVRAVNGISKSHASGTQVRLFRPVVRAL